MRFLSFNTTRIKLNSKVEHNMEQSFSCIRKKAFVCKRKYALVTNCATNEQFPQDKMQRKELTFSSHL